MRSIFVHTSVNILQHSRQEIQKHMESSTQIHLQYLLSTVAALQKQNDMLQENLKETQEKLKDLNVTNDRRQIPGVVSLQYSTLLNVCLVTSPNCYLSAINLESSN